MLDYNKIKQLNINQLKRQDLDSKLSFIPINDIIVKIKDKLLLFENKQIKTLTESVKNEIILFTNDFLQLCEEIVKFNLEQNESFQSANSRKDSIISRFKELEKRFNSTILPIIHDIMFYNKETQKKLNSLNSMVTTIEQQNEENNKIFTENMKCTP